MRDKNSCHEEIQVLMLMLIQTRDNPVKSNSKKKRRKKVPSN
jgi:hypothetical protein